MTSDLARPLEWLYPLSDWVLEVGLRRGGRGETWEIGWGTAWHGNCYNDLDQEMKSPMELEWSLELKHWHTHIHTNIHTYIHTYIPVPCSVPVELALVQVRVRERSWPRWTEWSTATDEGERRQWCYEADHTNTLHLQHKQQTAMDITTVNIMSLWVV